jgi:hypothetical protein
VVDYHGLARRFLIPPSVSGCGRSLTAVRWAGGKRMKVFLDDERVPPEGWEVVRWPDEAIALLKTGLVTDLSLDHDLGNDERGTGYDVLVWIEEAVATGNFSPPQLTVHSANSSARVKMMGAVHSIERLVRCRQ